MEEVSEFYGRAILNLSSSGLEYFSCGHCLDLGEVSRNFEQKWEVHMC